MAAWMFLQPSSLVRNCLIAFSSISSSQLYSVPHLCSQVEIKKSKMNYIYVYHLLNISCSNFILFLCSRHKMAEGHIEFTLSKYVCVSVFQICVQPITSVCMVGFKNHLAQMIIKTRLCVACKKNVARSKTQSALKVFGF